MLKEQFLKSYEYSVSGLRAEGFLKIMELLDANPEGYIVETGTARQRHSWDTEGQSTIMWNWVANHVPLIQPISIDISQKNIDVAASQTNKVSYICKDSLVALDELSDTIVSNTILLYLDSLDYIEGQKTESGLHHMKELANVWSRLPEGCIIAVDDRLSDTEGKHIEIEKFMASLGKEPVHKDYQIIWTK